MNSIQHAIQLLQQRTPDAAQAALTHLQAISPITQAVMHVAAEAEALRNSIDPTLDFNVSATIYGGDNQAYFDAALFTTHAALNKGPRVARTYLNSSPEEAVAALHASVDLTALEVPA